MTGLKFSSEYLAGLFDGEGCIDVQRVYPKGLSHRLYVRPRLRMCMADGCRFLGEALQAQFGGHMLSRKASNRNQQSSWSLEWLNQDDMRRLLGIILPHLVLKAEQAKLVLFWLDNMSGRQVRPTRYGKSDYSAGIDKARAFFVEELRAMKVDPQRLSERAEQKLLALMRQSEPSGNIGRVREISTPLAWRQMQVQHVMTNV